MSKAVMLSIRPEWVERILSGEKTLEIRKTRPKLKPPFRCYIYQTGKKSLLAEIYGGEDFCSKNGFVVAQFVCNGMCILSADELGLFVKRQGKYICAKDYGLDACMDWRQMVDYSHGVWPLYGWEITDLQVYDKPKPLSEFRAWNRGDPEDLPCAHLHSAYPSCDGCKECGLKRPPQSWCYVEERRGR